MCVISEREIVLADIIVGGAYMPPRVVITCKSCSRRTHCKQQNACIHIRSFREVPLSRSYMRVCFCLPQCTCCVFFLLFSGEWFCAMCVYNAPCRHISLYIWGATKSLQAHRHSSALWFYLSGMEKNYNFTKAPWPLCCLDACSTQISDEGHGVCCIMRSLSQNGNDLAPLHSN